MAGLNIECVFQVLNRLKVRMQEDRLVLVLYDIALGNMQLKAVIYIDVTSGMNLVV